eukprot:jgi/Mesvir1/1546/Mv14529-RA.1
MECKRSPTTGRRGHKKESFRLDEKIVQTQFDLNDARSLRRQKRTGAITQPANAPPLLTWEVECIEAEVDPKSVLKPADPSPICAVHPNYTDDCNMVPSILMEKTSGQSGSHKHACLLGDAFICTNAADKLVNSADPIACTGCNKVCEYAGGDNAYARALGLLPYPCPYCNQYLRGKDLVHHVEVYHIWG